MEIVKDMAEGTQEQAPSSTLKWEEGTVLLVTDKRFRGNNEPSIRHLRNIFHDHPRLYLFLLAGVELCCVQGHTATWKVPDTLSVIVSLVCLFSLISWYRI